MESRSAARTGIVSMLATVLLCTAGRMSAGTLDDRLSLGGDFRYRQEQISAQGREDRYRHRLRLRLDLSAKVNPHVDVMVTLASGTGNSGANNQTLDDAFDTKPLSIYRAYASVQPDPVPGLRVNAGKVPNPFHLPAGSELIWYVSLAPEGIAAKYRIEGGAARLDLLGCGFYLEERPAAKDSYLAGGQAVFSLLPVKDTGIAVGAGLYPYMNMRGRTAMHEAHGSGNTLAGDGSYVTEFALVEGFIECRTRLAGLPVTAGVHGVENTEAHRRSSGYWLGAFAGRLAGAGTWRMGYDYRRIEADAVIGWLTDALFAGGRSDSKGHRLRADIRILPDVTIAATYYHTRTGISWQIQPWYRSGQLDILFTF